MSLLSGSQQALAMAGGLPLAQQARRAWPKVTIDGHDATDYVGPTLVSFEYADNASGKSDEVQIELQDRDKHWLHGWLPRKNAVITARIECWNWHKPGDYLYLDCGSFRCDEPAEYSGPPGRVSIKAVSATLTGKLRETAETKAWENFSLQGVAGELAAKHGLQLYYDAEPHQFQRQDQREETDLAFLQRLARDRGVSVKVHKGKLILFDAQRADGRGAFITVSESGDGPYVALSYSFRVSSQGTGYDSAEVEYHDPATRELHRADYSAKGGAFAGGEKKLTINERVESEGEAQRLAKSRLREANKGEYTGSVEIMGCPSLAAGSTIQLAGFGDFFSGKWFCEKVSHTLGDKYTTKAEIRQALGY